MTHSSDRDRLTRIKIVAVSLIAGIAVVGIGVAARPEMPNPCPDEGPQAHICSLAKPAR